jgi:hypothetical protein
MTLSGNDISFIPLDDTTENKYSSVVLLGDNIIAAPRNADRVLIYNINTQEIMYSPHINDITSNVREDVDTTNNKYMDITIMEDVAYAIPLDAEYILRITSDLQFTRVSPSVDIVRSFGASYNESLGQIIIAPHTEQSDNIISAISMNSSSTTKLPNTYPKAAYSDAISVGNVTYLIPHSSRQIIKIS